MKRTEKIWLIVAAALVLAGALCMAGILSSRHWDLASFGTVETVEQSFDIDEPFDSISPPPFRYIIPQPAGRL